MVLAFLIKRNGKGNLFYEETYSLGIEEFVYGTLHVGGIRQRGTVTIEMTGTGCFSCQRRLGRTALSIFDALYSSEDYSD